jgi:hypothetical protein
MPGLGQHRYTRNLFRVCRPSAAIRISTCLDVPAGDDYPRRSQTFEAIRQLRGVHRPVNLPRGAKSSHSADWKPHVTASFVFVVALKSIIMPEIGKRCSRRCSRYRLHDRDHQTTEKHVSPKRNRSTLLIRIERILIAVSTPLILSITAKNLLSSARFSPMIGRVREGQLIDFSFPQVHPSSPAPRPRAPE